MQIFVSEYFTSGACCNNEFSSSLFREGTAMLQAVLEDCARLPNVEIVTTLDHRVASQFDFSRISASVKYHLVQTSFEEKELFQKLAHTADALFVIAPETGNTLADRKEIANTFDAKWIGCSTDAIQLCADKLALATYFEKQDIPTIPTFFLNWEDDLQHSFPIVIKPRDGAGSQMMFLVQNSSNWIAAKKTYANSKENIKAIWQPYIAGTSVSIAILPEEQHVLPVTLQRFSKEIQFQYEGGTTPFFVDYHETLINLVQKATATISGLSGYVGFDLILPENEPHKPLIVEINPRLTTSYVGYRALTDDNLMKHILFPKPIIPEQQPIPIRWKGQSVQFDSDGTVPPQ